MSSPTRGVEVDAAPTGSIDRTAFLSSALDGEGLHQARAALAATLDPQGEGERTPWQDPQTGAHGSFTAAGAPFTDQDRVCRAFKGAMTPSAGGERRLSGSACRDGDGTWRVRSATGA